MEFEREFVQVTLGGIRYYGIFVAVIIMAMAAWTAAQDSKKHVERKKINMNLGIAAIVSIAIAVAVFILGPSDAQDVQVRYYGIIIVAAMLVATLVATNLASLIGQDPEHVYGALTWAIIPGIVGARLWAVVFPSASTIADGFDRAYYFKNFFDTTNGAIAIWSGGLSIFGAILGGGIGLYLYLRRNNLEIPVWLDIVGVVLPLAQGIGRWGNWVNQELFGKATDLPWAIRISRDVLEGTGLASIDTARINASGDLYWTFHPLFLYESLWSIAAFIILFYLYRRYRDRFSVGDFFLIYVAQYAFIRFLLEFLRIDVTEVGAINLSQAVTAVAFLIAVGWLALRHRPGASHESYPDEEETDEADMGEMPEGAASAENMG
jgi:phosphatidylglycerol:prolipoprotein diacylglycerol transferase